LSNYRARSYRLHWIAWFGPTNWPLPTWPPLGLWCGAAMMRLPSPPSKSWRH